MNKTKVLIFIAIVVVILAIIYNCDKNIATILAGITSILGILFTFYSKQSDIDLKEKELKQQLTTDKQKEYYSNKIDAYVQLYNQSIQIKNYSTNNETITKEQRDIRYYEPCIREVEIFFNIFKENIFYISEDLDAEYQQVFNKYDICFYDYRETKMYHQDFDPEQVGLEEAKENEEKSLYKAYKCFCDNHSNELNALMTLVKVEIKEIRKNIEGLSK